MRLIEGDKKVDSPKIDFRIFNKGDYLSAIILICYLNDVPKYQTIILAWPTFFLKWRLKTIKAKMIALILSEGVSNERIPGHSR